VNFLGVLNVFFLFLNCIIFSFSAFIFFYFWSKSDRISIPRSCSCRIYSIISIPTPTTLDLVGSTVVWKLVRDEAEICEIIDNYLV